MKRVFGGERNILVSLECKFSLVSGGSALSVMLVTAAVPVIRRKQKNVTCFVRKKGKNRDTKTINNKI